MLFRLLAVIFSIFASIASAQDIRSIHPILDVFVVKFQRDPGHNFWYDFKSLGERPNAVEIQAWLEDIQRYYRKIGIANPIAYKLISDYNGMFYALYTNDPSLETKMFLDSSTWREDTKYISEQQNRNKPLFACSGFSRSDFRLYAFKESSPEIFLWQDHNLTSGRTYFQKELEGFNGNGRYFVTKDGRKWDAVGLPRGNKYRVRDIDLCGIRPTWVAILNNSSEYQGRAFTFQSRDLAVLWDQVRKYEKQGINLVDIEKGSIRMPGGFEKPLWYGVFSDSSFVDRNITFRIFRRHDELKEGISSMRDQGFSVVDIEMASRGSI